MSPNIDILSLKPFEICSIRPPTENASITFRLTRNCYWNRCAFCPVYKLGAKFSRRSIEEVQEDISRAQSLDAFMLERGIGHPASSSEDYYRVGELAEECNARQSEAGIRHELPREEFRASDLDPRMKWFLSWFNNRPDIGACMNHILSWRMGGGSTCFFGDADSLILKPDFLAKVIGSVKHSFSTIQRFTVYGRTSTAARHRSRNELREFAHAGLHRVHFGLETGSNKVLDFMGKGASAAEHAEGCLKTKEAGLSCSVYVMPGLGGASLSEEHAHETASLLSNIGPDFIRLRTLEVFPNTRLEAAVRCGDFTEAAEEQVIREIRIMIEEINAETEILSDSASNLLSVFGKLPQNRAAMLSTIDGYLSLSRREKLEFSLQSRLQAFAGQYGGISHDILQAMLPIINNRELDLSRASDPMLQQIIRLIRLKLMP